MNKKAEREANRLRQAAFVERWRERGYAHVRGLMAHVDDHAKIKAYAKRLERERLK